MQRPLVPDLYKDVLRLHVQGATLFSILGLIADLALSFPPKKRLTGLDNNECDSLKFEMYRSLADVNRG